MLPVSVAAESSEATPASHETNSLSPGRVCEIELNRARVRICGEVSPAILRLLGQFETAADRAPARMAGEGRKSSGVRESRTKRCFVAATVVAVSYLRCVASLNATDRSHIAQRQCAHTECRRIVTLGLVTM
jgi:hypothetical protein